MPSSTGDRSAQFPAIEKKHGKPIAFFLAELADLGDAKYADQIALLRERYGFSQAHANAVVMSARGSSTSRRFDSPETFLRGLGGEREVTARAIVDAVAKAFPALELVVAWNQPMFRLGKDYVFGLSAATNHLLLGPWGGISPAIAEKAKGLEVNKKTVRVPVGWKVDGPLLKLMVKERLAQLGA